MNTICRKTNMLHAIKFLPIQIAIFGLVVIGTVKIAHSAQVLETFRDWIAFVHKTDDQKICFITSVPKRTLPANVRRGKIHFYITTWPGANDHNQISVRIGYPFKPGSVTTAEIGSDKFELFTEKEFAFVKDRNNEQKLVAAMKRGNAMVVKGISARGTLTTDNYSLSGISSALNRMAKECP